MMPFNLHVINFIVLRMRVAYGNKIYEWKSNNVACHSAIDVLRYGIRFRLCVSDIILHLILFDITMKLCASPARNIADVIVIGIIAIEMWKQCRTL